LRANPYGYDYYFDGDGNRKRDRMGLFIPAFERNGDMSDGGFDSNYYAAEGAKVSFLIGGNGGGAISEKVMSVGPDGIWMRYFMGNQDVPVYDKNPNDSKLGEVNIIPRWLGYAQNLSR
jgi:hypothetical protein